MSIKLLRATFVILPLLIISHITLHAATVTWTGATDTDWDVPTNWDGGVEPTVADDVVIPSGLTNYPVITTTGNTVQSVEIQGANSTLDINPGAELTILGSPDVGLYCEGAAIILGTLNITDSAGVGLENVGEVAVHVNGTLEITGTLGFYAIENTIDATQFLNMGIINIVDSGVEGLFNESDFMNLEEINISGTHTGTALSNNDVFDNFGVIDINVTNFPEGGAIINNDTFTNDECARLTVNRHIDNSLGTYDNIGILVLNGVNNNLGTFANTGIIYNPNLAGLTTTGSGTIYTSLSTLVWTGCYGSTDWDEAENWSLEVEPDNTYDVIISNASGGITTSFVDITTTENTAKSVQILSTGDLEITSAGGLTISDAVGNGLHILGTFFNAGTLTITNSGQDGFRNESLNITNQGEINISGSGDDALYNESSGSFTNSGTINIEGTQDESGIDNRALFTNEGTINITTGNSPSDGSIWNSATFNNATCAIITVNNELDNGVATAFTNNGVITSTFNGNNVGAIDNDGVIYNLNSGTFTTDVGSNGFELTDTNTTVWNNCDTANTNWTNDGNWTADTPNGSKDAIIPTGIALYPTILGTANVSELTIEDDAAVVNEATLNAAIIDNSGVLENAACEAVMNITNNLTNNATGEISNFGLINLLGDADFIDNGTYTGYAPDESPPSILYVDKDATIGNDNGTSWEDAYLDLQDALAFAETCPIEIWVAEGGYLPTSTANRNISFNLPDGVELYGGFNGTETLRNQRDFLLHQTILSGDISTFNNDNDNTYQVVKIDEGYSVKIDGFTIQDGNANETDSEDVQEDGGGIYNLGEAIVQNCIFKNNNANGNGGAMYNGGFSGSDNTKIVNCIFQGNLTNAITNTYVDLSIINTLISGNDGGGINHFSSEGSQVLDLHNCTIVGNKGYGVALDETGLNAVNSIFWDNEVDGVQDESTQINTTFSSTVSFSCIEGGWSGGGSNNITTDPQFTTPIDPTTSPTIAGNFTLQTGSPAINTGNTGSLPTDITDVDGDGNDTETIDVDLAYNARVQDTSLDMGAYEGGEGVCSPSNVLFVDINASGSDDGTSWTDAYTDLQSALTYAISCNIITEIWVAQGTYKPTYLTEPTAAFVLQDNLAIYGGFSGTGFETMLSNRNIASNVTILSGDINNSNTADTGDSYHILEGDNTDNTAILDGFTIQHAYGIADGAGITMENGDAIIRNCIFQDNFAPNRGAAIFLFNSNPLISDCQFINNDAISGGAIHIENGAPKIIKCTFEGNTASTGGAVNSQGGNSIFTNCIFEGNSSTGGGAGMYFGDSSDATLTNCLFFDQSADLAGGGIFGINSNITVVNSTFTENSSRTNGSATNPSTGGGIFVNGGSLTVENSIFWDNYTFNNNNAQTTEIDSGAGAVIFVSNSIWQGNTSGGTIYNVNPYFSNSAADYFTLRFCSPARDIGNNAAIPIDLADVDEDGNTTEQIDIDLSGNNRIEDTTVDLGAYENSEEALPFYVEWDGEVSTDWTDPLNWCPNVVPTSADYVTIGNVDAPNYPVIDSDVGTIISLSIVGGSLTINETGTISLDNSTGHGLVMVEGILTNNGNIFISNIEEIGFFCFSGGDKTIHNNGTIEISGTGDEGIKLSFSVTFNNNNGGIISIEDTGLDGLLVEGGADFNNNEGGILEINGAGGNGLSRHGTSDIFNGGEIIISQFSLDKKLLTSTSILNESGGFGAIYNLQCASITFDDVLENNGTIATDGFIHANGNTFTNTGTFLQGSTGIIFDPNDIFDTPGGSFVNQGTILNESQASSTTNIWTGCADDFDWDTADNWSLETEPLATHDVIVPSMGESSNYPIINTAGNVAQSIQILSDASLTLNYASSLTLDGGDNGVTVKSSALLEIYGSLMIENSTNNGMINQGTIINEGFLNILNSTTTDINNTGTFTLTPCSETNLTGQISSTNAFTNNGLLTTSFDGTNVISGTFTNNGVINDQFDSFNGGADITNNDIIIIPITGCTGGTISDALIDGGTNLTVDTDWFTYSEVSEDGGDYNSESNTFTPDNGVIGEGTHTLYFAISDDPNECYLYTSIEVTIESCGVDFVWTGGSDPANTDWNDPDNWSTGIIPDFGDVVTIPDISDLDNYPIIDGFVEIGGLIIESNAEVTVADGGELFTAFNDTGIDIGIGASFLIEEGGSTFVFEASTVGVNVEGNLNVSGHLFISSIGTGINVASTGTVNDNGFIQINQGFGPSPEKTGIISVVNFLEIQNGGTFEVTDGDTLLIDGLEELPGKKSGLADGDIGIKIFDGGTFTSEGLGVTQVINITGTGIDNEGDVNNSGNMTVTAEVTGITTSNTFTNDGNVEIGKTEFTSGFKKAGGATVVNFLEIQNGGTFEVTDDGDLTIDGEDIGPSKKSGLVNDDTGIDVNAGGTFTSETNTTIQILNMSGLSTGIVTNGTIENAGDAEITVESTGIQVQSGTTENSGEIIISKIDGLSFAAKQTGGASVVNFLEIQNGGTFELLSGGSLFIDGTSTGGALKAGIANIDVGISIDSGGTFTSEDNSSTQILNMTDSSTGVETNGSLNNGGDFEITSDNIGISVQSGTVNNTGDIEIGKATIAVKKNGGATVVNFLEIQNGGTFEMNDDGTLIIDGEDSGGGLKSGILSNDTGIDIASGGTLSTQENTNIEVKNMLVGSKGIVNTGDIDNSGEITVTTESIGLQVRGGGTVDNDGTMNISKVVGTSGIDDGSNGGGSANTDLSKGMKTGGASVVNFLEIQNGGTFSVLSGGSLLINGEDSGAQKINTNKALLNDTGIAVNSGGTFISEPNSDVDVINMIGASIGVSNSGTVNNDGDFDITTEGKGIEVAAGTFTNGGELDISKMEGVTFLSQKSGGASVVNFLEIQNGGTFTVLSNASLIIDGQATLSKANNSFSNDVGIDINAGGTFEAQNNSTVDVINMIGTSTGVVNSGELTDAGDFTITTENIGMQVQSDTVEISGTLTITTIEAPSKSMSKKGGASVVNFLEIQNGGTFEILEGGEVIVDGLLGASKKLNNDTGVTIDSGGQLITESEAALLIKNIGGQGTGMKNRGTVTNDGTVDIRNIGGNGLENTEDFNNNDCSVFSTDCKVVNEQTGEWLNQGLISSTYGSNGEQHENDGVFVNEGIIEDPNNAFVNIIGNPIIQTGDGGTTSYTLFNPLFTCYGEVINNATNKPLDTDGIYNVNMWYTDISLTQEAGMFEYSEAFGINRFTPDYSLLGPGVHLLFVSVESDNFVDCGARNVVLVQLVIHALPEIVPIHQSICVGETLTESLAVENKGATYTWYDQETGGNQLTTGTSYLPNPQPTESTTYWVEAINAKNCESDGRTAVNFTIYDYPTTPNITSSISEATCNNTFILDAGNYPANHTYLWSTDETTQTISVAALGTYTVTVTNEGNCSSTADIEIIEDPNFNIKISGNTEYCLESNVELDAGTYSNNDSYIWSNNATTQTIAATAGTYTVTVTNDEGCSDSAKVKVKSGSIPPPQFANNTLNNYLDVCSEETGAIYRLNAAYTQYQWSIVNGTATNNPTTGNGGLGKRRALVDWGTGPNIGQVYVTVTDENDCTGTSSWEVNIAAPVVATAIGTAICEDETATVTATGGGTYLWSTGETSSEIEVMPTTNTVYTVTVTNSIGCTDTAEAEVTALICCIADAGTLSLINSDVCAGEDILATTNNSHQTATDYELYYLLVNDFNHRIEAVSTDGVFSGVAPDGYDVYSFVQLSTDPPIPSPVDSTHLYLADIGTIDDGCYDLSDSQGVIMPYDPEIEVEFYSTEDVAGTVYIADITISGGTILYDLDLTIANGFAYLEDFSAHSYSVYYDENTVWDLSITDANGCGSELWNISSADNPNIFVNVTSIKRETCIGEEDGAITIDVSGGIACTPSPSYIYAWSGPNNFTSSLEDITNLVMGEYHLTVTDCDANSYTGSFEVKRKNVRRGRRGTIDCNAGGNKTTVDSTGETFLQIRPNPFSYYTTIEFGMAETGIANLTLYTLDGRKVTEIYHTIAENDAVHRINFEAENIQPGMYLLQLMTESGEMVMEKLVVR